MTISLSDAGKRYNRDWIFRHFNIDFITGHAYAITGPNGSGKSTLLQCIGGSMMLNEGGITYSEEKTTIDPEKIYPHVSLCAPYLDIIEEMTLREFLLFHQQFKPLLPGITVDAIIDEVQLSHAKEKQIRNYSSGMKQRAKLAQAIFSNSSILLLDEPCTNLDITGIELYHSLISRYRGNRIIIVSSNDKTEYEFCEEVLKMIPG